MPYSIPGSTKILIYILWQQHYFLILVGTLCVCEFAMVPGVFILLYPPGREGTLFFLDIQLHNHQKVEKTLSVTILLWQDHWKTTQTTEKDELFMVLVI